MAKVGSFEREELLKCGSNLDIDYPTIDDDAKQALVECRELLEAQ